MIQSSVWQAALEEGRAKGLAEGVAKGEREVCSDLVRDLHPAIADRVLPVIESCSDRAAFKRWALLAAKGTDADLLKELGLG
jgi:hypothetical protein